MKKIIALFGAGSTGKTTTLKVLIDRFRNNSEYRRVHIDNSRKNDVYAVFERIRSGVKIAITTAGDTPKEIRENIAYATKHGSDVLITASRTSGQGVDVIYQQSLSHDFYPLFISKTYLSSIKPYKQGMNNMQIQQEINEIDIHHILIGVNEFIR